MTDTLHQTFFQRLDIHARREFVTELQDFMLYDDVCCVEVIEAMRKARLRKQEKQKSNGKNNRILHT